MKQFFSLPLRRWLPVGALLIATTFAAQAQNVGVGTTTPDAKAALEISANDKGLLIPRLDSAQRVAITSPPDGLMVFQKNGRVGLWYAFGGTWSYIPDKVRSGDNLGSHTATQNLNLGPNKLVGNGGSTGISVTSGGLVGINTTSPLRRLTLATETFADGILISSTTQPVSLGINNGTGSLELGVAKNAGHYASTSQAGDGVLRVSGKNMVVATQNGGSVVLASGAGGDVERMRVSSNGNIGIGTTSPANTLHLNGTMRADLTYGSFLLTNFAPTTARTVLQGIFTGNSNNAPQLRFTGVGTTYMDIGQDSTGNFVVEGNDAIRLMVQRTGNVGIGTTAPVQRLHVNGNGVISGNLGVGTTTPAASLHVNGNMRADLLAGNFTLNNFGASLTRKTVLLGTFTGSSNNGPQLRFTGVGATYMDIGQDSTGNFVVEGNDAIRFLIQQTGNVGIGTTAPTQRLDVNGGVLARSNASISNQGAHLQWNRSGFEGETWLLNQKGGGNANAGIRFGSATTANVVTEWGRFIDNGNFGIGTAAPAQKLHVSGNGAISGALGVGTTSPAATLHVNGNMRADLLAGTFTLNNFGGSGTALLGTFAGSSGNGPQLRFEGAGAGFMDIGQDASGNFVVENSDNTRLTVNTNGNVGIGTTTPANLLDVRGNANNVVGNFQSSGGYGQISVGNSTVIADLGGDARGGYGGTNNSYDFRIRTGAQDRMFFEHATGEIGINTTAPSAQLDVNGSTRLRSLTTAGVVTTDALGNLSSVATSTLADNLGNHTATTNLNLGANEILGNSGTIGIGVSAGGGIIIGQNAAANVLVGYASGDLLVPNPATSTGANNTFIGRSAGASATTAFANTFVGTSTGGSTTSGQRNTFVGASAGSNNSTGSYHTFMGTGAGFASTTGSQNTLIGFQAGTNTTTGSLSTMVGSNAGITNTTGSNLTLIGQNADVTVNNLVNAAAIGYNAKVSQSNSLALGGTGADAVSVGIGVAAPTQILDVNGGILARGQASVSTQGAYLQWNRSGSEGETWVLNQKGLGAANAGIRFGSVTTANATTEWARFLDNGNFGVGATTPTSLLTVGGAVAMPYTTTGASTSFTLNNTHQTVRRFGACTTITIPQASTCTGRLYTIINSNGTGSNVTLTVSTSGSIYDDVTNTTINALAPNNRITIQSDGTNWIVIGR